MATLFVACFFLIGHNKVIWGHFFQIVRPALLVLSIFACNSYTDTIYFLSQLLINLTENLNQLKMNFNYIFCTWQSYNTLLLTIFCGFDNIYLLLPPHSNHLVLQSNIKFTFRVMQSVFFFVVCIVLAVQNEK